VSDLYCVLSPYNVWTVEDEKPTIRDLNRYIVTKYATNWYEIGIELGIELCVLDLIKKDNPQQSVHCLLKVLDKWLKVTDNPTWKILEVALTNVTRQQLNLDPVDDVYGESVYHACL